MNEASDSGRKQGASAACPICQTDTPLPGGASTVEELVRLSCSLCGTAFTVSPTGDVAVDARKASGSISGGAPGVGGVPLAHDAAMPGGFESPEPDGLNLDEGATVVDVRVGALLSAMLAEQNQSPAVSDEPGEQPPTDHADVGAQAEAEAEADAQSGDLAAAIESEVDPAEAAGMDPDDVRAFEGNLSNLSAVDVLQLLHANRKSGVLSIEGAGGRATLTVKDGHIVACSHPTEQMAVGQILVEMGLVGHDDIQAALEHQGQAGESRALLVATLIEQGKLEEAGGTRALKKLVEATVVEVVSWAQGHFYFRQGDVDVTDSFCHVPAGLSGTITLDVQATLMDALRIIDERARDAGGKADLADLLEPSAEDAESAESTDTGGERAPVDLEQTVVSGGPHSGLGDLDDLDFAFEGEAMGLIPGEDTATHVTVPLPLPVPVASVAADSPPAPMPPAAQAIAHDNGAKPASALTAWMRTNPILVIAVAAVAGVVLAAFLLATLLAADDETNQIATESTVSEPVLNTTSSTEITSDPEPEPEEAPETQTVEGEQKTASPTSGRSGRKKRKRRKAKSARSLFDAALNSE